MTSVAVTGWRKSAATGVGRKRAGPGQIILVVRVEQIRATRRGAQSSQEGVSVRWAAVSWRTTRSPRERRGSTS